MRPGLLDILVCPSCRNSSLELVVTARDSREVRSGLVFCPCCTKRYPIENGIIDLLDNPPEAILREQQGWLKLLGPTGPELDSHMLQLPYLDHELWWSQAAHFDELLERVCLNGLRVLDVGSGRTWSARWLLRRGVAQVVATDIARQKYLGLETADLFFEADSIYFERVLCDMEDMPFAPAHFDAVFSTASIHHALDLRRTFLEMNRMLRPGGAVLLTNEPVRPYSFHVDLSDSAEVTAGINEHIYTIEEWLEAAERAGFDAHLFMSRWVVRAYDEGRLDQVLVVRPAYDYLPWLLGSSVGRRLLDWQPLLFNAYHDYGLPLIMVARKQHELPQHTATAGDIPAMRGSTQRGSQGLQSDLRSFARHIRPGIATQGMLLRQSAGVVRRWSTAVANLGSALRSRMVGRERRGPLPSALSFDSEIEPPILHGLYPAERAVDGCVFCWTAPDAELTLRRPPRAHRLRLRLALPPVPRCLTVAVDGVPVGSLRSEASEHVGSWRNVTFDLPAAVSRQPPINLRLDQPWSPAEIWRTGDMRMLGVALAEIAFV